MPLIRKAAGASSPAEGGGALDALRSGTDDQRWAAARALSGRPEAVSALGAALRAEPDARVREAILTSLVRIGLPESADAILPMLRCDDASRRTGAVDALRLMPGALAVRLGDLLNDADADVRVLACDLARELPAGEATGLLCDLMAREPEANVCAAAVDVLVECAGPEALAALAACAERFNDVPFLVFSLKVASGRIRDRTPPQDG
jgi:HEAT repeat protein